MAGTDDEWPSLADPTPDDEPPADDTEPTGETVSDTEPSDDDPADQLFPTYQSKQPDQRPSRASQVKSIAGIACVCLVVLTLVGAAIGWFFLHNYAIVQISWAVFVVGLILCVIVATVADELTGRGDDD